MQLRVLISLLYGSLELMVTRITLQKGDFHHGVSVSKLLAGVQQMLSLNGCTTGLVSYSPLTNN